MLRPATLAVFSVFALSCYSDEPGGVTETPPPPPSAPIVATVGPDGVTISVGGKLQYQATSNATVAGWDWSLSDPTKASVSTTGLVTGVAQGQLRVIACARNTPSLCGSAELTVATVTGGPASVTITPSAPDIQVGQTVEFVATSNFDDGGWTWRSLDEATGTISDAGQLTGRRAGTAVVVACAKKDPHICGSAVTNVH